MDIKEFIKTILTIPGESRTFEFKRLGISRNESIDRTLQSIIAMANTDGGCIILGVDDPEKSQKKGMDRIYGIEENLELYDELGRKVSKISPPISNLWPPVLLPVDERNVRIGLLSIPKVVDQFRTFENHVYIRLEKGNKLLNPQEIIHFSYIKGFQRADQELVNVDLSLLKTQYYEAWRRKRHISDGDIDIALEKTGLARRDENGRLRPVRAAVLLFADYPNDLMDTKCTTRISAYSGNQVEIKADTLNLIGMPKTVGGPIIKQIQDAQEYTLNLLRSGVRVPSGFVTMYAIPERAVKEAITNAVIHRDYYTKRDIEIRIFENRLEVESPGLFPFNITPSNIGYERAFGYRNDLLVKHLREFPDPPNLDQNEGVRVMRAQMKDAELYPPIFCTYPIIQDGVCVVLFNEKAPNEWEKVAQYLNVNKYIGNAEARKILGIQDTIKVSKIFRNWVKKGLLLKVVPRSGAKRLAKYRLPNIDEKSLFAQQESK